MKKSNFYILIPLLLYSVSGYCQLDSINHLEEIVLSDIHLSRSAEINSISVFNDSVLEHNPPALASVLKFNSPIFLRENGAGGVASASFRGTTASQTAVVWNGININSQFTGQTDFNAILTSGFDNVAVKSGGGSVLYGSGAIGGSIHLNNNFRFSRSLQNKIHIRGGSFDTYYANVETEYSTGKLSLQLSVAAHDSENDFLYPDLEKRNENGDFTNISVNVAIAYLINNESSLRFYTNYYNGDRGFSGTLTAPSKSKYEDRNSRNLLEWKKLFGEFTSTVRLAYLDEHYKYFENRNNENFSYGRAKSGILKHELEYRLNHNKKIFTLLEYQNTTGEASNISESRERNIGSIGLLYSYDLYRFNYELSTRFEFSDRYDSPLLFSAAASYAVTDDYLLKINVSRNYRIPTFNDLFWQSGGNPDLRPENSLQAEVGQEFRISALKLSTAAFVIETQDLLRWVPSTEGVWRPENTSETLNYGLEARAEWHKIFNKNKFSLNGTYAYTRALDQQTEKQLIYVPAHKATANVGYAWRKLSSYFQVLYNSKIFTSSDNRYTLDPYTIANAGLQYDLFSTGIELGIEVQNIFNIAYQNMPSRPMPGRSFYSSFIFKF